MQSSLSSRILRLAASARTLAARMSAAQLATSVVARSLAVQAQVGIFLKALEQSDGLLWRDAVASLLTKGRLEALALADQARAALTKLRADTVRVSDTDVRSVGKRASDAVSVADALSRQVQRPIAETLRVSESFAFRADFVRALAESAAWVDATRRAAGKTLGADLYTESVYFAEDYVEDAHRLRVSDRLALMAVRAVADGVGVVDAIARKAVGRVLGDGAALSDRVQRDMGVALTDALRVTDDLDGAASIDDDQEVQFVKARSEWAGVTDTFYRQVQFARSTSDAVSMADSAVRLCGRALSDTVVFSDVAGKQVGRGALDSAAVGDSAQMSVGAVRSDQVRLAESGSLRSQGYCEFSFFAEDYVGSSRTF